MAQVYFQEVLILDANPRTSKSGNPYVVLHFLDEESYKVYELMQFGDDSVAIALGLHSGDRVQMAFDVEPDRGGGVRLVLSAIGAVN